ncbi:MAG: biopolymer transporter ExbD [Chitinispirillia bacterium]|nr:biopolymer transporter ExbD [Chitinispirillia bacterium]MCL2241779.1 biopolymer transporter ExbD [Chitinispirillia bacterium]
MANKLKVGGAEVTDVDLKVFMNLMVVLIPMLIVSAEFATVAIIDIKLPEQRGSQTKSAVTEQPSEDKSNKLLLTAIITDSVVTLGAKGGFMPSLFYQEFHRYITRDEHKLDTLIEYVPGGGMPKHPYSGRELTIHERFEIYLYTVEPENRNIIKCMYTRFGEMLTDAEGLPVRDVKAGDTVFALTNPRRRVVVTNPGEFDLKPLSAYDELKNRLMKIKERYQDADDGEDIIIAAENEVIYDKIVQIMDAARQAEFPNISIAKLRG